MTVNEMNPEQIRVATAEQLANLLNREGIRYAVLNGLYGYPERVGRDLDIIVNKRDVPKILWLIQKVKEEKGWEFLFGRWSYYGVLQLYLVSQYSYLTVWLEIDLMCDSKNLLVGLTPLVTIDALLDDLIIEQGPFKVSPRGEYLKAYFRPIFYGDIQRFRTKYSLKYPQQEEEKEALRELLGEKLYKEFLRKIQGPLEELEHWHSQLKWRLNLRYLIHHPFSALRNLVWTRFLRPLALWLFNPGLVVAVVGPDGVGKSSAIQQAVRHLDDLFDIRIRHWRPGLLPAPAKIVGRKPKQGGPPSRTQPGLFEHWLRIGYYWLDYVLGYFLKDRFLPKSVIQLVIYDRHAIDAAVDPLRYRLRSTRGVSLLYRLAPRPYVILLIDKPERIAQRKNELSLQEIQQQLEDWKNLAKKGFVNSIVEVGNSVEETGQKLVSEILKVVAKQFDVRKTWAWRQALRRYGFKTVYVNGICRLAWPANYDTLCAAFARRMYVPFRRLTRLMYSLWWKFPIPTPRLEIRYTETLPRIEADWNALVTELSNALGESALIPVFYFPLQPGRKKLGALLLRLDGQPVGFAKIGWGDSKREIVNEADVLTRCKGWFTSFDSPRLLCTGEYADGYYAIYEPLSGRTDTSARWSKIHQTIWEELVAKTRHEIPLQEALDSFCAGFKDVSNWLPILKAVSSIGSTITYSFAHGDFAPWNIVIQGDRVILLDWEEFSRSAPYLVDPVYFILSVRWLVQKRGSKSIIRDLSPWIKNYGLCNVLVALLYLASHAKLPQQLLVEVCIELLANPK